MQNNMKRLLVLMLLPIMGLAQIKNQNQGFVVKGDLKGLPEGTQMALNSVDGHSVATGKILKGAFSLKGQLPGTDVLKLSANGTEQSVEILMNNETVTVSGTWSDPNSISVKGAAAQADFESFKKVVYPFLGQRNALVSNANTERDMAKRNALMTEINKIDVMVPNVVMQFADSKPSSVASAWALYFVSPLFENRIAELENAYVKLQSTAKKLVYVNQLEQFIARGKIGMIGSQAMDFTQNDVDGKPVSLSSFKGKYVLVDFWASWCGPCRGENPNVVSAYEKYKDKNFTVLGVSLDQAKPNWLKAIKDDNLTWTHVSDLQYWNNAAARLYRVESIPTNLLIDPTGKIIGKNIRGEELQKKLAEVLK
jgi:thiol-disulfide isomerase/thioredoxin